MTFDLSEVKIVSLLFSYKQNKTKNKTKRKEEKREKRKETVFFMPHGKGAILLCRVALSWWGYWG